MIGVGVVGYGYWGPNLARNIAAASGGRLVAVCDLLASRRECAGALYPGVGLTGDYREVIANPAVDAVAIATPVSMHYELAMAALRAGKHVLVEKPLATSSDQARRLRDEALRRRLVLLVDFTFLYAGAARKMRELIADESLGELCYYDAVRVNPGYYQSDMNVVWDLAVHDVSLMHFVLPEKPVAVSATAACHSSDNIKSVAYLTFLFSGALLAHIHVNWFSPLKMRRTLIGCRNKLLAYDDLDTCAKLKIFDMPALPREGSNGKSNGLGGEHCGNAIYAPVLDTVEALQREVRHFFDCIEGRALPLSDAEMGVRIVTILEAVDASIEKNGAYVALESYSR